MRRVPSVGFPCRRPWVTALILWGWLCLPGSASAARMALLVGNNEGNGADVRLRYAESDTARLAALLIRVGGFSPEATVVKLGGTAQDLRRALADTAARARSTAGEHLVLLFYSGHADGQNLHLGASSFPIAELVQAAGALPGAARVLVLDACQAGVITRAKGGSPGLGVPLVAMQAQERTRGLAILASSAGSELAQESDELGAGVFTHYLHAGLSGLADRDRDGGVSLTEVFDYASERTLAATLGTSTGPQHPTFRLDIDGSAALTLTRPSVGGRGYGHVRVDVPGWYFIRRRDGTVAAELVSRGNETLALDAGPYEITRRGSASLDVASVAIVEGQSIAVSQASSRSVAFGRMVRKGSGPAAAYAVLAATTARTSVEELGVSTGIVVGGRADLSAMSLELRLGIGRAHRDTPYVSSTTWEGAGSVAALRMRDFGGSGRMPIVTAAVGIVAGLSFMDQHLDMSARHGAWSPFAGPTALAEVAVGRRFFLRFELGAPIYALGVQRPTGTSREWRPALSGALGGGASF